MPTPPPGEADLRNLGESFAGADGAITVWLAEAASGDRRHWLTQALDELAALRRLDHRRPVVTAYLHEHRNGSGRAVSDLAASLASKLDRAAQSAADAVRGTFPKVTAENIAEMVEQTTVAYVDRRGGQWSLGHWAMTNCQTIGRQASSRGVAAAVGRGKKVIVDIGECALCEELFAGELIVGQDALPPGHPGCTCTASAAA